MLIRFSKMHGLGNDFMVVDGSLYPFMPNPELIKSLAHRHIGVGFDQLLLISPDKSAETDFIYRIFNADGSEVEQCGNGARCVAAFIAREGLSQKKSLRLKIKCGVIATTIQSRHLVCVEMGSPILEPAKVPFVADQRSSMYTLTLSETSIDVMVLSMGNPHCVLFLEDISSLPIDLLGSEIARHPRFPESVNVEFAQIISADQLKLRVFERGAGETLACGSGACAAVVAGILAGKLAQQVSVELPGGQLQVSWEGDGHSVFLTGPATHVYDGQIFI